MVVGGGGGGGLRKKSQTVFCSVRASSSILEALKRKKIKTEIGKRKDALKELEKQTTAEESLSDTTQLYLSTVYLEIIVPPQ